MAGSTTGLRDVGPDVVQRHVLPVPLVRRPHEEGGEGQQLVDPRPGGESAVGGVVCDVEGHERAQPGQRQESHIRAVPEAKGRPQWTRSRSNEI